MTKDMNYTGGIAGNNKGIINNCVFSGNITADADSAGAGKYIGGIAGKSEKTIKKLLYSRHNHWKSCNRCGNSRRK